MGQTGSAGPYVITAVHHGIVTGTSALNGTDGTTTCTNGEAVLEVTAAHGIVTNVQCGTPVATPASELATLRSLIEAQNRRIVALEQALAGQGGKQ